MAARTNFLSATPSFGTLLARRTLPAIKARVRGTIEAVDGQEPGVTLACSYVHDGCLDLSHLSRRDQVELCCFTHWGIVYSHAGSLGCPITKLSLPPENILCKDEHGHASVPLFSEDEALPVLDPQLLDSVLGALAGGVLVEYGKVGARELLRISHSDGADRIDRGRRILNNDLIVAAEDNTDFFDLVWARACLKRGNALDARLDALSAKQWKEATRQSVEAFKHLIAMPITRDNEEKFVELLKLLADDDSWSACDAIYRVEWSKGCEQVANALDEWKGSTGSPTQWKRWTEHSKALRALLQGRMSDTSKARRELSSRVLATPPEDTGTAVKAMKARKRAVQVAKDAQTVWRSRLVEYCLSHPVDATQLLELLEELVESGGWSSAHKRDLLQEEFNGKTLLEHLGDTKAEEFFSLFERLQ